jgi:hypothetical protein
MPRFKDRTGKEYGRLIVISHEGKDHRNKHLWRCKCSCGNEKVVVSDNLSSGKSKSCGCLLKEFLLRRGNQFGVFEDREEALLNVQYSHVKRRHVKFNYGDIVLSRKSFETKVKSQCKYCGMVHSKEIEDRLNETKTGKRISDFILKINGLDRLDINKGYTEENTVSCCKFCNFAKHTMSENDFYLWIKKVYEHLYK